MTLWTKGIKRQPPEAQKIKKYEEKINGLTELMKHLTRRVNELERDYHKLKESVHQKIKKIISSSPASAINVIIDSCFIRAFFKKCFMLIYLIVSI